MLVQAAQGRGGCPSPEGLQGQFGWDSETPGLVEVSVTGRLEQIKLQDPFQHKICNSMRISLNVEILSQPGMTLGYSQTTNTH